MRTEILTFYGKYDTMMEKKRRKNMGEKITFGRAVNRRSSLFEKANFEGLPYRVYTPKLFEGEKVPLVLFLHGAGERGEDNKSQLKRAIRKVVKRNGKSPFMRAVVLAPQCPTDGYWTNVDHRLGVYEQAKTPETAVLHQVAELVKRYCREERIDKERVYVVGMSMGGYATWDLIARYPELFAAAVAICGGGPIDKADVLKEIPVYVFHGKKDRIVPYRASAETVDAIRVIGGTSVLFKTYPLGRHNIWNKAITFSGDREYPPLDKWLFAQRKKKK